MSLFSRIGWISLVVAATLQPWNGFAAGQDDAPAIKPVVISNAARGPINRAALRAIFSMQISSWPDGTPIRVFVLTPSRPEHEDFALNTLGVYPYQLERAWERIVFSGQGQRPTTVRTMDEMLSKVASTPGAIGYADASALTGKRSGIQVVEVQR